MASWLNKYIQGERGSYFFQIELIWGREISGGMFLYKQDALSCLQTKLEIMLNDPDTFFHSKSKAEREQAEFLEAAKIPEKRQKGFLSRKAREAAEARLLRDKRKLERATLKVQQIIDDCKVKATKRDSRQARLGSEPTLTDVIGKEYE